MERIDLTSRYSPIEMALHSCRYLPARNRVLGKKVLDIACGEGVGVGLLLKWGAAEVVGVDLSQAALSVARENFANQPKARFICSDAFAFLDEHGADFDVVISVETIEHLPDPGAFLKKLATTRRNDSTLIISCPNDYFYYGRGSSMNPHHMTQFSFYDFRSMAEKHLGTAHWYLGAANSGFSAVSVDLAGLSTNTYATSFPAISASAAAMVPGPIPNGERLKPSNSLFYLGIWSDEILNRSFQVSFPSSSHYRLPGLTNVSMDVSIGKTRRAAFIIDQHDWAFDNIIRNMEPSLQERYDITRFYICDYDDPSDLLYDVFVKNEFDNVHFMWREFLFVFLNNERRILELLERSKMTVEELAIAISNPVLTTSVYDHLYLREEDIEERQKHFSFVDGYATSSQKLYKIYAQNYEAKPVVEISDGVNIDLFVRARDAQSRRTIHGDQVIKIGWVGNSSWGKGNVSVSEDPKGLHSILVPAIERLVLEGYPIALALADRNLRKRDREEMVTYYGEIDILVCASEVEGTPNPVLEAMASGIPFVSTDVGIVRQVAGAVQSDFVLARRDIITMYNALKKMLDNPEIRAQASAENLDRIRDWGWETKTLKWLRLFKQAEQKHEDYGKVVRKTILESRIREWELQKSIRTIRKESSVVRDKLNEDISNKSRRLEVLEAQVKSLNLQKRNETLEKKNRTPEPKSESPPKKSETPKKKSETPAKNKKDSTSNSKMRNWIPAKIPKLRPFTVKRYVKAIKRRIRRT